MSTQGDIQQLIRKARKKGYGIERTKGGHSWVTKDGNRVFKFSEFCRNTKAVKLTKRLFEREGIV